MGSATYQPGDLVRVLMASDAGRVVKSFSKETYEYVEIRLTTGDLIVRQPYQLTKISLLELLALAAQ